MLDGIGMVLLWISFLVAAIAALGMRTSLDRLVTTGWRPVLLIVLETLFLCGLGLALLALW